VSRPSPLKPDNFFVQLSNAFAKRRTPIRLRIFSHTLILLAITILGFVWLTSLQLEQTSAQLATAVGSSLQQQTAVSAITLLATNDRLGLTILLDTLLRNPLVAHAAILTPDYRIIAEAGQRLADFSPQKADQISTFASPLIVQDVQAARLHISLNMKRLQDPFTLNLQNMGILAGIVLLIGLAMSLRLANRLSQSLTQLRVWLRDPVDTAPGIERQDEIGELARQLQATLGAELTVTDNDLDAALSEEDELSSDVARITTPPTVAPIPPAPVFTPEKTVEPPRAVTKTPASTQLAEDFEFDLNQHDLALTPPTVHCAALSIHLGAQHELKRLPQERLRSVLTRYRDALDEAVRLHRGTQHSLDDGGSLILFHENQLGENYLNRALCCGELMRAVGYNLQMDIADSGLPLQLELGLSQGENLHEMPLTLLLLQPTTQRALELGRHSRNLLLYDLTPTTETQLTPLARLRRVPTPPGACCIERLQEPLAERVDQQLNRLLYGRGAATPTTVRQTL